MACSSKTFRVTRSVWSDGTTNAHYLSFLRLRAAEWGRARVSVQVEGGSGALTVSTAAMYGDIEAVFDSASAVNFPSTPLTATTDGDFWGTGAALDTTRQLADIGLQVKNTSGSKIEQARVTLIIDVSES